MKKFLSAVLLTWASVSFALGAFVSGTRISDTIVPLDDTDEYPTHDAKYGKEHWILVANAAERTSLTEPGGISEMRRTLGMVAFQLDTSHVWKLSTLPNTWTDLGEFNATAATVNLYTQDGTLLGNRTIAGDNKSLTLSGLGNWSITGTGTSTIQAVNMYVNGTSSVNINQSGNHFLFPFIAASLASDDTLLVQNPSTKTVKRTTATLAQALAQTNLFNTTGTLTGNRSLLGGGYDFTIQNVNTLTQNASTLTQGAGTVTVASTGNATVSAVTNLSLSGTEVRLNNSGSKYIFKNTPTTAASTDEILGIDVASGEVRHAASATIANIAAASTFYNSSGALSGNRTVTGGGYNLSFSGIGNAVRASTTVSEAATTTASYSAADLTITGVNSISFNTPNVEVSAAEIGQYLRLGNTSGSVEFATAFYTGIATQSGAAYSVANTDLLPDYDSASQHAVGTIAYVTLNAASIGADTLKLGPSTDALGIVHQDGSAIAAGELQADYPYTFVKTGSGGSAKWVLQGTSSSTTFTPLANRTAVVTTVADLVALDPVRFNFAITKGYYAADDRGDGAYYWVSNQTSTNYGAKIASASSGSWVLLKTPVMSSKVFGIVDNILTDQTTRIAQFLTAAAGRVARFEPGSYRSTSTITIPANTKITAYNAIFSIEITGAYPGIAVNDNTSWEGGSIVTTGISGWVSGEDHTAFTIGDYTTGVGYNNITIKNVTVATGGVASSNAILVTGDSSNVYLADINVADSASTACGILVHWGVNWGAGYPSLSNLSKHPHNISIERCKVGALTYPNATSGIHVSGAYAVTVRDCTVAQAHFGLDWVAGDYGFKYSGFTNSTTLNGVSFNNCLVKKATGYGIFVNGGVELFAETGENFVTFNDCNVTGPNTTAALSGSEIAGIFVEHARHVEFRNISLRGFQYGVTLRTNVQNVKFIGGVYSDNRINGFKIDRSDSRHIVVDGVSFERNGWGAATAAYGISITDGYHAVIKNCNFGDTVIQDPIQELSIRIQQPAVQTTLINNHISSQKATYVNGYNVGNTAHTNQLWLVSGNTANSTYITTLYTGSPNIPIATRGGSKRIWTGTGVPTYGHYSAGDIMVVDNPQYGPSTYICTVAGSPGTWVASATADSPTSLPNADFTFDPNTDPNYYVETSAITANRTVTLSTTGAYEGCRFTLMRGFDVGNQYYVSVNGVQVYSGGWTEWMYRGGAWAYTRSSGGYRPVITTVGDADSTQYVYTGLMTVHYTTPLTTNRTLTLSTNGAANGSTFKVVRSAAATGASTLTVEGKVLAVGTWAEFIHNGSAFVLTAYGSL